MFSFGYGKSSNRMTSSKRDDFTTVTISMPCTLYIDLDLDYMDLIVDQVFFLVMWHTGIPVAGEAFVTNCCWY